MSEETQIKFVGAVFGFLLILLCFLMYENTSEIRIQNEIKQQQTEITLREEYERVLIGCNTAGAMNSNDPWMRKLCDEKLVEIRETLFGEGD